MPKRRAPDRKKVRRNWLMSGVSAVASLAFNHPAMSGGTMVFGIVFSFVAANALWYQPQHPHPLLDTRSAFKAYVARAATVADEDGAVTTFKIERREKTENTKRATTAVRANVPDTVGEVIVLDDTLSGKRPAEGNASELVRQVQENLARRGLYDGEIDGLMGPQTVAAIDFYQQTRGMETTGEADLPLLNALKADNAEFAIVPPDRPLPEITNAIRRGGNSDADAAATEVHAAIPVPQKRPDRLQNASSRVEPVVLRQTPETKVALKAQPTTAKADPVLVMQIQQGLANLAYVDIAVDGVAGSQTRTAISHFQKHYRLPVSGEPDELVLEKLKQIGAL